MLMGLRYAAVILVPALFGHVITAASAEPALAAVEVSDPRASLPQDLHSFAATTVTDVAAELGVPGGFYRTPRFHIELPRSLSKAVDVLGKVYAPLLPVQLELTINRAAEATARPARDALLSALDGVNFADPAHIVVGPPDAMTATVKTQVEARLRQALQPIVAANLDAAGARVALAKMRDRYEDVANAPFPAFDLDSFTLDSFLDAFFADMAQHEADVRFRPSARSTAAMKRLFSAR